MASKSQKEYMMTCALVIGCMITMGDNYAPDQYPELSDKIKSLKAMAQKAFDLASGSLDEKEIKQLVNGVGEMQKVGLEGADSCQTLLSMLIGIVSEKLTEIPGYSPKVKALEDMLLQLEAMYAMTEESDVYDKQGLVLLNRFGEVFS